MDLLIVLKGTIRSKTAAWSALGAALSVVFVLALWPTDAGAAGSCPGAGDCTAVIGHISASVVGTLSVEEISAINFGNFAIAGCTVAGDTPAAGTPTTDFMTLTNEGTRTAQGCFTPLNGSSQTTPGVANGTNFETGGQSPGFYQISGVDAGTADDLTTPADTDIYISFSDIGGDIVDSCYGSQGLGAGGAQAGTQGCAVANTTYTHPNNYVTLTGPTPNAFAVNQFTFETDNGAAGNGTSGYTALNAAAWDATPGGNNSGNFVPLSGTSATLRVGATLIPLVAAPAAGKYTGSFYIMVSY